MANVWRLYQSEPRQAPVVTEFTDLTDLQQYLDDDGIHREGWINDESGYHLLDGVLTRWALEEYPEWEIVVHLRSNGEIGSTETHHHGEPEHFWYGPNAHTTLEEALERSRRFTGVKHTADQIRLMLI